MKGHIGVSQIKAKRGGGGKVASTFKLAHMETAKQFFDPNIFHFGPNFEP